MNPATEITQLMKNNETPIQQKTRFFGGIVCAFMSGLLFTVCRSVVKCLNLDFEECMFARYLLQIVVFSASLLMVNFRHSEEPQISFWVQNVEAHTNIHTIRSLLILQGIFSALNTLGQYISAILMPIGDASAIIYSSTVPTMILANLFLGTKLKLYKICCGLCVVTGIILVIKPPRVFGTTKDNLQEFDSRNSSDDKFVNQTNSKKYGVHGFKYYHGALAAVMASVSRGCNTVAMNYLYGNQTTKSPLLMGVYAGFGGRFVILLIFPFHVDDFLINNTNIDISGIASLVGIAAMGITSIYMLNKAVKWIGTIIESFIKSLDVIAA